MQRHNKIRLEFEERECQLLTTSDELDCMPRIPKLRYIASCGHEHQVFYNVFIHRGTGIKCPSCVSKNSNKNKIGDKTSEGQSKNVLLEDNCIEYITEILKNFEVKKTFEGCLADIAIRPVNSPEDKWLMVQVKSTNKPLRDYAFKMNDRYKDCMIFCVCYSDKKMWLFDGNNVTVKNKIAIGLKKSKYDVNEVDLENIDKSIMKYYNTFALYEFNKIDIPISDMQKQEKDYREFRVDKCKFLNFEYPTKNGLVYDFIVNGHKVQEKVGSSNIKSVCFCLWKNNGKKQGKRQFQYYQLKDCEFYWLNFPDKKNFYVIPANILLKNGYISDDYKPGQPHLYICLTNIENQKNDYSDFLFNYENIDVNRLEILLK
jgi:hypothetical protein